MSIASTGQFPMPGLPLDGETGAREMPTDIAAPRRRNRRMVELFLLALAVGIAMSAYAVLHLNRSGALPASLPAYAAGLGLLALVAHVAVRQFAPYADPVLLPCVVLLNGLGLVMIHRLDLAAADAAKAAGEVAPTPDAPLQLTWTAVGVALFVLLLALVRDHRLLQRYTYTFGLVGVALLLLPLAPGIGRAYNGSRLWIRVFGFSFQPGEAAKIALILFFAGYLVVKRDALALAGRRFLGLDLPRVRDLGPILVAWIVSLGVLIFQKDLGSSLLFFGVFVVLLYVATERPSWLIYGAALFFGGAYVAYQSFEHVQSRVELWLHAFQVGQGNQIVQSLYGLAAGGILGTGLGNGHPQLVPEAKSDFIVAAFGEELGLTGLMALIMVFALIVERGLRTGIIVRDNYGKLLATGLAASLALQVFVVVGGVTKLIPLTGLTTPFMSQGGSSLIANWVVIAILLRISDAARRPVDDSDSSPPGTSEKAPVAPDAVTEAVRP